MLGYRCEIAFNPTIKIGWVVLTNTTDFDFSRLNDNISRLILPLYNEKGILELDKYIGTYRLANGLDSLKIYRKGDSLYSSYLQDMKSDLPLIPSGNNSFKEAGKGKYSIGYEFIPNQKSEIEVLNMGQLMWVKD
jgi:hypothetical protein